MRSLVALSILVILVTQPIAFAQTTNSTNQTSTNQTSSFSQSSQISPGLSNQTNSTSQNEITGPGGLMSLTGLFNQTTNPIPSNPLKIKEHHPAHIKKYLGAFPAAGQPNIYTPQLIWVGYGFNSLGCTHTTTTDWTDSKLCGHGQIIGIVDAFDDPTIESDLGTFDTQWGLPSCTIANACFVKSAPGGITTDSGWALEISLDVEWAHSIAPGAKIVLVESIDSTLGNLLGGVDTAVGTGAQQVSNSWGGSELSTESSYDYHYNSATTSFFVASGDGGHGVEYPAASPYVISVGGTTLNLDSNGNYLSETAWSGSGGGISKYEPKPSYQNGFNSNSNRAVPDVAYNGDPNTGVYVFDSTPICSTVCQSGWWQVGGTSAGAPQWAGISAIANSQNAKLASASFGTSNALYGAASGAPSSNPYLKNYHDITSGSNGACGTLCDAGSGYDEVTGLGSPQANNLIPYLIPTCGVSFTSGNPINFGSLSQGQKSAQQTLTLHNTGNTNSVPVTVYGANWLDGTSTSQMVVGQTTWSLTSGGSPPGTYTALTTSPVNIVSTLSPSTDVPTYWQLVVNLLHPTTFHGSLTQQMTFTATC